LLISSYNKDALGDVLIVTTGQATASEQAVTQAGDVVAIFRQDNQELVGVNLFHAQDNLPDLTGAGQVFLNENQVDEFNGLLQKAGVKSELVADLTPKFVVGQVLSLKEHPNSDHLHIAQVDVGAAEPLQIVCGAPNIGENQKVVVALVGAMMPDGKIIWPGELRGIKSLGMICSARELGLKNAPAKRGILVLDHQAEVGSAFDFDYQL
jgi:tRNA-binding protein